MNEYSSKKLFQLVNCEKSYSKKVILENINLQIEEGSFHALVGENGSGKSTLLKLMSGNELLDEGDILFANHSVFDIENPNSGDFIFISEQSEIIVSFNLDRFIKLFQEKNPNWSQKKFDYLIRARRFDLARNFQDLSRGQKMQFNLMMALASNPRALLVDEVTAVLDIEARHFFLTELKNFSEEGGCLVITSNIITELEDYADSISVIKDKQIIYSGRKKEFRCDFCKVINPTSIELSFMQQTKKLFFQKDQNAYLSLGNNQFSSLEEISLQEIVLYYYSEYHQGYHEQAA